VGCEWQRPALVPEQIRRFAKQSTEASFRLSGRLTSDLQQTDQLEYGEVVPGVTCPECGGELVHTSIGARCDWDQIYVPIIGTAVLIDEDEPDDSEWNDPDGDA
jgi:hypothetical protein